MIGKAVDSHRTNNHLKNLAIKNWLNQNRLAAFLFGIIACLALFGYGLLCTVDAYSQYCIAKSNNTITLQSDQFEMVMRQVDELQRQSNEKSILLTKLHQKILSREGRLKERHFVNNQASRLVAHASGREAAAVSRSFPRYSPFLFDVTMPSAVTAYELEQILGGTQLAGLGRSFIKAELVHGINAMFLVALAIHESHWGQSDLAQDKNNLYGFGAYDASPYSSALTFASKHECVLQVAEYIRHNYIDGPYSNGRNIADINQRYASDTTWSQKVFMLMMQLDQSIQANDA